MNKPTVDELMAEAFPLGRDSHSAEYIAGVRSILESRIEGVPITLPYQVGSAQADAYVAGQQEGKAIWRELHED